MLVGTSRKAVEPGKIQLEGSLTPYVLWDWSWGD